MIEYEIKEINDLNIESIIPLQEEAIYQDGTRIVDKMINEWKNGENKFDKKGEKAWGLFVGDECIAFAGVNIDPYLEGNDGSVGRLRHVYVAKKYRGMGLSKVLVRTALDHAKKHFKVVRLTTNNPIARHVYESFGFTATGEIKKDKPIFSIKYE
jgi:predicted GNAT family acetyltransferase